jgi:DNA-binding transcriptional LysR family regulator
VSKLVDLLSEKCMTPPWDLYRTFLAAMEERSLSGAARLLGLTQPTASRHVQQLEEALGLPLFTRSPSGLHPTAEATALLPHARAMARAADAMLRAAAGEGEARGVVRITASEVIGAEILPELLASFREEHPGVVLELGLSNRVEDLLEREADLAVRTARPTQAALLSRQVGTVILGLHAHRRYLQRHGVPTTLSALEGHALIGYDRETPFIHTMRARGLALDREQFVLRTDSDLAQLAAIRAGLGIGICQAGLAARDPELVRVLADPISFPLEVWLVTHEDLRGSQRIRLLLEHLARRWPFPRISG